MDTMNQKIDEYFKEISKGDYEKFESLILNDYEEIRDLYFTLRDYSNIIDTIEYKPDVDDEIDIVIIDIHTSNTSVIKDLITSHIPEFKDVSVIDNIVRIISEEY